MADTDYEIILYRKGTAGTITYTFGDSSLVIADSRRLTRNENDISTLEFQLSNGSYVAAENFLSASFAGWSGGVTGALQLGDYVKYSLYPTKTLTKTQYFYGKITELQQTQDGRLKVTAQDYLKKLSREYTKVLYEGYRDSVSKTATWADGAVVISGISDSDVVNPFAAVQLVTGDSRLALGGTGSDGAEVGNGHKAAQAFYAEGDVLFGAEVEFKFGTDYAGENLTCDLCIDNGGTPGTIIATKTTTRPMSLPTFIKFEFTSSGTPVKVRKGSKYWLVISTAFVGSTGWIAGVFVRRAAGSYTITSYRYYNGSSWSTVSSYNLHCDIDGADIQTFDADQYAFSQSAGTVSIVEGIPAITPTQSYVTPVRGLVSYFYGTLTSQKIADALLALNTGLASGSSANQTAVSGTFSTLGKKLLESLQELADQYQPSGSWAGYQLAFAHYEAAGAHTVKFGRRMTTADSSYATFSHGLDTSTDEDERIIDWSQLKLRTDLRPSSVVVIGKDASGNPLCYTVTDRALSGSFESRMEGFANVLKLVDDNLTKMEDVQAMGNGSLAAYSTNVWEGQIKVSGVYPDLIDLDTTSATFGSGKIITLNLSPLGISATKFKVKGVVVEPNQTTITISNDDVLVDNAQRYYNAKAQRTEAFYAPVGLVDNMYIAVYYDGVVDWANGYMGMLDGGGNLLTRCAPVHCEKHPVTALNLNVYHAEFERDNGYSAPPQGVRYFRMGNAPNIMSLGAGDRADYNLLDITAPRRDERFDKFKTSRLIVDFMTKIS